MTTKGLVWLRRDLRLYDHHALSLSLSENSTSYLVFVFDTHILTPLRTSSQTDYRVSFICESLKELSESLQKYNAEIIVLNGDPCDEIPNLAKTLSVSTVYFNSDYTPYSKARDTSVRHKLAELGISSKPCKDHVIFEPHEVLKDDQTPYKVFTPFSKKWLSLFQKNPNSVAPFSCDLHRLNQHVTQPPLSLADLHTKADFSETTPFLRGGSTHGHETLETFKSVISTYHIGRDFPAQDVTSKCSVYIRHGCVSIRDLIHRATSVPSIGADTWLNELIWREFYHMVLSQFPHSEQRAFNPYYDDFPYPGSDAHFEKWCSGNTGVPIVDAAMRCLNQTGWMHNRLRMITASFLCKILHIHWKKGERYFAKTLLDYDNAANNGGWQWASGTGCDAAPYFRIFNPYTQSKKFDPEGIFIKTYCPELKHLNSKDVHSPPIMTTYPQPIVDYKVQRTLALDMYHQFRRDHTT